MPEANEKGYPRSLSTSMSIVSHTRDFPNTAFPLTHFPDETLFGILALIELRRTIKNFTYWPSATEWTPNPYRSILSYLYFLDLTYWPLATQWPPNPDRSIVSYLYSLELSEDNFELQPQRHMFEICRGRIQIQYETWCSASGFCRYKVHPGWKICPLDMPWLSTNPWKKHELEPSTSMWTEFGYLFELPSSEQQPHIITKDLQGSSRQKD